MRIDRFSNRDRLSNRDRSRLNLAITESHKSACKQRHGAVVTKGGDVVGKSYNVTRNQHDTMEIDKADYTIHAEIAALKNVNPENVRGSTVYVARINKAGLPMLSKPCTSCLNTLNELQVKRIVHT